MHATYSPDDNKLRFYPDGRLDADEYKRARAAGFRWAPRQKLFVCPAWSPAAEDLMLEWCGEIDDEDSSLMQRAEERAECFEDFSGKRAKEAESAHAAVSAIADGIPLGQPILVGHHSEKRARRDAAKIENGMRRALKLWDTSEYWVGRAHAAKRHAKYLESAPVRARRIKKLEADRRRHVRTYTPIDDQKVTQHPWATKCRETDCPGCQECETQEHGWHGRGNGWVPTRHLPALERAASRWIQHLDLRLSYERAMLEDQGGTELLKPKPRPKLPPLLNYRPESGIVELRNRWNENADRLPVHDMTKAEWKRKNKDYKGSSLVWDGSHRFRTAMVNEGDKYGLSRVAVYLTDSKEHEVPA